MTAEMLSVQERPEEMRTPRNQKVDLLHTFDGDGGWVVLPKVSDDRFLGVQSQVDL